MTYLEIVNAVLRRLREDTATTVLESDYSTLIGEFVNDAKRLVEDSWDWQSLRSPITVTTVSGTDTYTLTGTSSRTELKEAHNLTENLVLNRKGIAQIREDNLTQDTPTGTPVYFSVAGVDVAGQLKVQVYPTPDAVESLKFYTVNRTGALENDADTVVVPSAPIIQYAYSYALAERGETGGQTATEQAAFARQELTNAISLDAGHAPEELIWDYV